MTGRGYSFPMYTGYIDQDPSDLVSRLGAYNLSPRSSSRVMVQFGWILYVETSAPFTTSEVSDLVQCLFSSLPNFIIKLRGFRRIGWPTFEWFPFFAIPTIFDVTASNLTGRNGDVRLGPEFTRDEPWRTHRRRGHILHMLRSMSSVFRSIRQATRYSCNWVVVLFHYE